jgi:Fibrobacter succinogenes major domain (Fib_succ_major)
MNKQFFILPLCLVFSFSVHSQKLLQKVGTNPTVILPSAALEVESTTKGFLPPRMTLAQRDAIPSPATGLIIWCTDCSNSGQLQVYDGVSWTNFIGDPAAAVVSVTSLDCAGATNTGILSVNTAASGVSSSISYTGGNGGVYIAQSFVSTGVTGLTATLSAGTLAIGSGTLSFTITGTPNTSGLASFAITFGGQNCTLTRPVGILDRAYGQTINGANNHNFVYYSVIGADGKTWLNNNLGAYYANQDHPSFNFTQQATSETDYLAYGSLFQWGRPADGHELITWTNSTAGTAVNGTTTIQSNSDTPADNLFITTNSPPNDWRGTQNDNLWQGVNGINNPCPVGYRVPTIAELNSLATLSSITSSATAASSTLKFTLPGTRNRTNGSLFTIGINGQYWATTAYSFSIYSANISSGTLLRAFGNSVRCIKD